MDPKDAEKRFPNYRAPSRPKNISARAQRAANLSSLRTEFARGYQIMSKALPLLMRYSQDKIVPIERPAGIFNKRVDVIGGWRLLDKKGAYGDGSSSSQTWTDPDTTYVMTEDKMVGWLPQNNNVLHAKKDDLKHMTPEDINLGAICLDGRAGAINSEALLISVRHILLESGVDFTI